MFPKFLVIGSQKCGTTWLQDNLENHPQIWLPPTKEIHYLDRGDMPLSKRLFGSAKRMRKTRAHASKQFRAWLSGGSSADLRWALSCWLARRDDDWYSRLFPDIAGKIPGEICPGYARLNIAQVERVKNLMPSARIIYLLRNPIERSWSYAAQYFTSPRAKGSYGSLSKVPDSVLREFLKSDVHGHSDYLTALDAWQPHYPPEQFLLGFFDELKSDPRALFIRILDFLEIDPSPTSISPAIRENRHGSRDSKVPHQYRAFLAGLHLDALTKLHDRLQTDTTQRWRDEARLLAAH